MQRQSKNKRLAHEETGGPGRLVGRISIANSDTEAYAYVQAAIDAAIRAAGEVAG